jgi:hypothetical protein
MRPRPNAPPSFAPVTMARAYSLCPPYTVPATMAAHVLPRPALHRCPSWSAWTRPCSESRPGSQPVARPSSLSSVVEWVSKTSSIAICPAYECGHGAVRP